MNYIEEALLRQGELLRQLAGTRGRAALEMREGERSPSLPEESWETAEGDVTIPGQAGEAPAPRRRGGAEDIPALTARGGTDGTAEEVGRAAEVPAESGGTAEAAAWAGVRELSLRCERDARRYDGAFSPD